MLDLAIVLAFVVYAVAAGFRARQAASRNLGEYFLAGRKLPGWKAGVSMAATQFAADTPLLVCGLIATGGVFLLWRLWIYGLAFLLMAFVFSSNWRRAGVLTDAELVEVRYSGDGVLWLRALKAIYYGTIINCVVLAMVMVAAVRIAEVFLPWNQWLPVSVYEPMVSLVRWSGISLGQSMVGLPQEVATTNSLVSVLLILGFTSLYSTTGGLRSVVATDVVQFILAMAATFIYGWLIVAEAGGLRSLADRVIELYGEESAGRMLSMGPPELTGQALLPLATLIGLQWLFQMNSDGTGYLAQRSMACATEKDARFAGVLFAWMQILVRSLIWLVIGVGLLVLYPYSPEAALDGNFAATREMTFVAGIDRLMPVGVRGVMLAGLLAALASTVDTHLNWGASYWSNDLYGRIYCRRLRKREPTDRELVLVARLSNALIVVVALAIMANLGSIQTAWFISLLFGAGVGSVLVLRWLWERINLYSELAAMAVSLVAAPLLLIFFKSGAEDEWIRLGIMALVSTVASVGITLVTPATRSEILVRFYRTVRPAGFWSNTARAAGDDPRAPRRKLLHQLKLTAICSVSLFLMLVGAGRLLISPSGTPVFGSWASLLLGALLIPVWWRGMRSKSEDS